MVLQGIPYRTLVSISTATNLAYPRERPSRHLQDIHSSKYRVNAMASAGSRVSGLLQDSYEARERIPNIRTETA